MADTARARKLSERIQQVVAQMLDTRIKDPRLGFVTITEVDATPDLRQAKVYVSVLGPEEKWVSSFKALESARGFIWSWLRKNLDLRVTPQLLFRPDRSMEHAARMSALLSGLRPADDGPDED